jgi:hypothetical protein
MESGNVGIETGLKDMAGVFSRKELVAQNNSLPGLDIEKREAFIPPTRLPLNSL